MDQDEHGNLRCPECGSFNIAEIRWGMPAFTEELQKALDEGRVVLGGCCIALDDPKYECNACRYRFGKSGFAALDWGIHSIMSSEILQE